ncbi:hypothetical protein NQ318_008119 [Aromia moschata]|uniref:Uncharacterized protein n=1 Tax=Aromia moschata TaxID=1265417 RepID=A0AAV8YNE3_9CUCU|nr:hypothetical protein NQ318_008119 [Aromia moschata]
MGVLFLGNGPILDYGHTLFINCRKPAINNIKTAETSSLRIITKMRHPNNPVHNPPNEHLYQETQLTPITDRLQLLSSKFARQPHNRDILQSQCRERTPNRRSPCTGISSPVAVSNFTCLDNSFGGFGRMLGRKNSSCGTSVNDERTPFIVQVSMDYQASFVATYF